MPAFPTPEDLERNLHQFEAIRMNSPPNRVIDEAVARVRQAAMNSEGTIRTLGEALGARFLHPFGVYEISEAAERVGEQRPEAPPHPLATPSPYAQTFVNSWGTPTSQPMFSMEELRRFMIERDEDLRRRLMVEGEIMASATRHHWASEYAGLGPAREQVLSQQRQERREANEVLRQSTRIIYHLQSDDLHVLFEPHAAHYTVGISSQLRIFRSADDHRITGLVISGVANLVMLATLTNEQGEENEQTLSPRRDECDSLPGVGAGLVG